MLILSGLVGALLGALTSNGFQIWKLARDEFGARVDELCRAIFEAAALASQYWATDFAELKDFRIAEASLYGKQTLIDALWASLKQDLQERDARRIDSDMSDLLDALTGGDFTNFGRQEDPVRVSSAQTTASRAVVRVRNAHRRTIPLAKGREDPWSDS